MVHPQRAPAFAPTVVPAKKTGAARPGAGFRYFLPGWSWNFFFGLCQKFIRAGFFTGDHPEFFPGIFFYFFFNGSSQNAILKKNQYNLPHPLKIYTGIKISRNTRAGDVLHHNNTTNGGGASMARGRFPVKALAAAMAVAVKRGLVRLYERGPGSIATFAIVRPGLLAEVRIKRLERIGCTKETLDRDAAAEISGLKMFPSCPQISRELWGISEDYFIRFFRILENGMLELGSDGEPLPAGVVVRPDQVPGPVRYLRRRRREMAATATTPKVPPGEEAPHPMDGNAPSETDPFGSTPAH